MVVLFKMAWIHTAEEGERGLLHPLGSVNHKEQPIKYKVGGSVGHMKQKKVLWWNYENSNNFKYILNDEKFLYELRNFVFNPNDLGFHQNRFWVDQKAIWLKLWKIKCNFISLEFNFILLFTTDRDYKVVLYQPLLPFVHLIQWKTLKRSTKMAAGWKREKKGNKIGVKTPWDRLTSCLFFISGFSLWPFFLGKE